ncbi:MAG: hypothetical protein O3A25_17445 [Acidobacteria bacterium]|nr:hypothetical protein [Acidobacteriota bacterium]
MSQRRLLGFLVRGLVACVSTTAVPTAAQAPAPAELVDRVVAVAANQVILLSDVRAFVALRLVAPSAAADPFPEVLTALIERQLVLGQIPANLVAAPSEPEIDERLGVAATRLGGAEALDALLPTVGFTRDDVRQVLRDDLRIERYLARRFPGARQPTPEEVRLWIAEHSDATGRNPPPTLEQAREEASRQLTARLRQDSIDAWVATLVDRGGAYRVP